MTDFLEMGGRLKTICDEMGLKQAQFAKSIEVAQNTVSDWEHGKN